MSAVARRRIGGLELLAPLPLDEERQLYVLITQGREAEHRLASEDLDDLERRRLRRIRHAGQEAESTLLRATCGLVRARVVERGYRFGNEELEAAGVEGLVNALQRFDPARGHRFATYANYWITKLVNEAIRRQAGLTETEMRAIVALRKVERSAKKKLSRRELASALGVSVAKVDEIMALRDEVDARRYAHDDLDEARHVRLATDPEEAPYWVIEALKRLCGTDFDAFWQYTFRTMSLEEIARQRGISRQAMTKRIERCRRAVRESPDAQRLEAWLAQQ